MLLQLDERAASQPVRHTEYGVLYNRYRPPRDETMPTMLGLQFYPQYPPFRGSGFRAYNTPPTLAPETQNFARMAYDDIPNVELGLPWERMRKTQQIG